ncbi:MAG TPA: hypothetical protein VF339_15875, partial [Gammaproteobacteria bacterium]
MPRNVRFSRNAVNPSMEAPRAPSLARTVLEKRTLHVTLLPGGIASMNAVTRRRGIEAQSATGRRQRRALQWQRLALALAHAIDSRGKSRCGTTLGMWAQRLPSACPGIIHERHAASEEAC